jgi:hypothetical protein
MWRDAANHDPKLISRLVRCGELLICVRGSWHYHWEAPSVWVDQPACEVQSVVDASAADPPVGNPSTSALER